MSSIEILAPVGNMASLKAAINAKADAVYFAVDKFNMRSRSSENFTFKDLDKITKICRDEGIKCYVTLNSVMYDDDLPKIREILEKLKKASVDAVIASDLSVITYARSIGLRVHASTQLNICNIEAVRFFAKYCDVMVLARELTLAQIKKICEKIKSENILGPHGQLIKVEVFAHGALCVAIAGKCYMSLAQYNMSANRGKCLQSCRRKYRIIEEETNKELIVDNQYIMSPKDLCVLPFLDQIYKSDISILKIEGRGRTAEYVFTVVSVYKEALDAIEKNDLSKEKIDLFLNRLQRVYNRGFWIGGYYLGQALGEWSGTYGSKATTEKIYVGKVTNYYSNKKVVEMKVEAHPINTNDPFYIIGHTTGVLEGKIENLCHAKEKNKAKQGEIVSFYFPTKVRKNDKLYLIQTRQAYENN